MTRFRIQTHGRLQEWVAEEKGYFSDEGLDYEFVDNRLMNDFVAAGNVSPGDEYRTGAFETMAGGPVQRFDDALIESLLASR